MEHEERLKTALADRYEIGREIGSGGMATVYLAQDLKHDRQVAVKVLNPELAAVMGGQRFLTEIKTTANLQHPHILPLFDSGEADGFLYYVMPYVSGESLRERMDREKQLPIEDAIALAGQVADALRSAHGQGVVHRDIRPENILLKEGQAVVADFGISLAVKTAGGDRLTETGLSLGTPAYMSPEQVVGERDVDGRSDIYSLACVVYEMLAGEPPFTGPNPQAVVARHVTDPVPPITTVRPSVPKPVHVALTKALGKTPADRFDSALSFAEALGRDEVEAEIESIVVLPFESLSPDPENEYFADGLTDELIAELSTIRALRVISRTSAVQFKGTTKGIPAIARELGVRHALEGTVRRSGNNVRITAQLIHAATDTHLWAERYSGTLDDIFDLQEDLARRIAEGLQVTLSPVEERRLASRPIADPRAFDTFLLARHEMFKFSKEGIDRATELLHGALGTIGDNALLYAALSYASWAAYDFGIYYEEDTLSRGEQYAAKALELDPDQPLAHYADGLIRYKRGDLEALIRSARHAVELEPASDALFFLAFCLAGVGKIEEAKQFGDESVARDPLFFITILGRAVVDLFSGSFDAALDRIRDGRDRLAPGDPFANWWLAKTLAYGGHEKEAHALFKQVAAQDTGFWSDHCRLLQKALEDDREGVLEVLSNTGLRKYASTDEIYPICLANALTRVGEIDEALKWVDQSVSWGFTNYQFLSQYNPFLAPLRDDDRFKQMMERARQKQEAFSF